MLSFSPVALAVHPHRRGDGIDRKRSQRSSRGSPPQAWGRHARFVAPLETPRFTPTGVGTAMSNHSRRKSVPVHPHRRGDGRLASFVLPPSCGSPPQAWGRPDHSADLTIGGPPVHPHRRGDGAWEDDTAAIANGSPPQAWGRLGHRHAAWFDSRFTPTGVGTASAARRCTWTPTVHPHRRGDGPTALFGHDPFPGSPPQAWGRRGDHRRD